MAGASNPVKCLGDITECPICAEVYTDPRMLPCIHTFCLKCISTYGKDKQPGDCLTCPLCRKEASVPAGGLRELQRNIFLDKLLDVKRLSSSQPSGDELCEVCDKTMKMSMYCVDCQQSMCPECAGAHKGVMTTSHKLVEISNQSERVVQLGMLKVSESFCDKHEGERLNLYCIECMSVVCLMCFVHSHRSHHCIDVKEAAEEMSGKMKVDVKYLAGKVAECQNTLKQLTVLVKECSENANKTEREIIARANFMKQQIDQIKDSLIQEVRSNKKVLDSKLETLQDELEIQVMMMESFRRYSDELLEKGTACDVVRLARDMQDRARKLMQVNVSKLVDVESCQSKYTLVFSESIKGLGDLFGHMEKGVTTSTRTFNPAAVSQLSPEEARMKNIKMLCLELDKHSLVVHVYYSSTDRRIHVAVDKDNFHAAEKTISRLKDDYTQRMGHFPEYVIELCTAGEFKRTTLPPTGGQEASRPIVNVKPSLRPGTVIASAGDKRCFLFGGSIMNFKAGITVGHALCENQEAGVTTEGSHADNFFQYMFGKCLKTLESMTMENGEVLTADTALLEIDADTCCPENNVFWPRGSQQQHRIRMYNGAPIPGDTPVLIMDQDGMFQQGYIRRESGIVEALRRENLHGVLAVSSYQQYEDRLAITRCGDSGALVMSVPSGDDNEFLVYGMVIGLFSFDRTSSTSPTLTVANDLPGVTRRMFDFT